MHQVVFARSAIKDIKNYSPQLQKRFCAKLAFYASQDNPLDFAITLTQPADAEYRFRIGDYRVLFDIDGQTIVVLHVQHMREVYR